MQKVKTSNTFSNTNFSTSNNRRVLCIADLHHIIGVCTSKTVSGTITTQSLKKNIQCSEVLHY
jgi:hypothetical protein